MKKLKRAAAIFGALSILMPAVTFGQTVLAEDVNDPGVSDEGSKSEPAKDPNPAKPDTSSVNAHSDEVADAIIEEAKNLPSSIDLRNFNGKNYVTPVKYQAPYTSCWAFSIAGAAEISYLFANDLGVPAGEVNNNVDFSEKHINWFMYNRIKAEDVNETDIESSQVGEGFNTSVAQKRDPNAVYSFGGNMGYASNLFASGMGPVKESYEVNGTTPFTYNGVNGWRDNDRNESAEESQARRDYYYEYYKDKVNTVKEDGFIDYEYQYHDWFNENWKPENRYYDESFKGTNYSIYDDWSLPNGVDYRIPGVGAFFENSHYCDS